MEHWNLFCTIFSSHGSRGLRAVFFLFGSSRAEKLPLVGGHRVGLDGGGQRGGCTPRRVNDFFF